MAEKQKPRGDYTLEVPLDASQIEGFKPEQELLVVVQRQEDESLYSETVRLSDEGRGSAVFTFNRPPGSLRVFVGPSTATSEELLGMQTLSLTVSARQWQESRLILPPWKLPPYYWYWWLSWCREFTIRGRVLCPDGNPVPGAQVCAYDVDKWWWFWSTQQVGACDTTDASGAFEITFRWCCGWWPWWWWQHRYWRLEPTLVDRILPALKSLKLERLPMPSPKPDLALFEGLLTEDGILTRRPAATIDPADLDNLRGRLVERLPAVPELSHLQLWPWYPWWPWWDCSPDIIFRVTQNCLGQNSVIVDETVWDTRMNIPTTLNVTLVANDLACCINDPPPPPGDCLIISPVCGYLLDNIGGNPGAAPSPLGYANPGWVAPFGDRPFAGNVDISGQFGAVTTADYYEFEWATASAGPWTPMPPIASGDFSRVYWGPQLGGGPVGFHGVLFKATLMNGQNVYESREHFEANNDPANWGVTRFWTSNRDLLTNWLTRHSFADDTYYLRVRSWTRPGYAGDLANPTILPLCNTEDENGLVLTIDNQVTEPPATHPHPCGPGTVHVCTREPDTSIDAVLINGIPAEACAAVNAADGGTLDIDFTAHDPDGHLAYYTLQATYGINLAIDLLTVPGATLSPIPPLGGVPSALQVGPSYANALNPPQSAPSPTWAGGRIRLHIPNLRDAFPETCCYQLELRAYKRTIVDCYGGAAHNNLSEYSITVIV